jgi:hypothetical protein
MIDSVTG